MNSYILLCLLNIVGNDLYLLLFEIYRYTIEIICREWLLLPSLHTCTIPLLYIAQRMKRESEDQSMCDIWSRQV